MARTSTKKSNDEKVKDLLNRAEQGIKEFLTGEKFRLYLSTMSKFHHYSARNTLLILMQRPDATMVAGYSAWQKKFNRQVRRGEAGLQIIGYSTKTVTVERELKDANGKTIYDAHGDPEVEEIEKKVPVFSPTYVWDVSQTDGEPLPVLTSALSATVNGYQHLMTAVSEVAPFPITFEPLEGTRYGYCNHAEGKIVLRSGMSEAQTVKTAIHELAHSILHTPQPNVERDRHTNEVQAESVAFVVCDHFGIDTSDYSFPYLAAWSSSAELTELQQSMDLIQRTANDLIEKLDKRFAELQHSQTQAHSVAMANEQSDDRLATADQVSPKDVLETADFPDFLAYAEKMNQPDFTSIPADTNRLLTDLTDNGIIPRDVVLQTIQSQQQDHFYSDIGTELIGYPSAKKTLQILKERLYKRYPKIMKVSAPPEVGPENLIGRRVDRGTVYEIIGYENGKYQLQSTSDDRHLEMSKEGVITDLVQAEHIATVGNTGVYYMPEGLTWGRFSGIAMQHDHYAVVAPTAALSDEWMAEHHVQFYKLGRDVPYEAVADGSRQGILQFIEQSDVPMDFRSFVKAWIRPDPALIVIPDDTNELIGQLANDGKITFDDAARIGAYAKKTVDGWEESMSLEYVPDPSGRPCILYPPGDGMLQLLQAKYPDVELTAKPKEMSLAEYLEQRGLQELVPARQRAEGSSAPHSFQGLVDAVVDASKQQEEYRALRHTAIEDYKRLVAEGKIIQVGSIPSPGPSDDVSPEKAKGIPEEEVFAIYQLPPEHDCAFLNYDMLTRHHHELPLEDYECVYAGKLEPNMTLEYIYEMFTLGYPQGYRGRGLSVADLVVVQRQGTVTAHFVDSFGYKEVPFDQNQLLQRFMADRRRQEALLDTVRYDGELDLDKERTPRPVERVSMKERFAAAKEKAAQYNAARANGQSPEKPEQQREG